jgi:cytochrome c553
MKLLATRTAGLATLLLATGLAAGSASTLTGCPSPAEDTLIESLGPEVNGVEEGEHHRYGQPCLACHGGYGPGEPTFSVAGTVFATPNDEIPVLGAKVVLTDANGSEKTLTTNCAGNFYAEEGDWDPVFPLRATVECPLPDGTVRRAVMGTRINRDGSCAGCHANEAPGQNGPGRVYCVAEQPANLPFSLTPGCSGGPKPGDAATTSVGASSSSSDAASSGGAQ